MKMKIREIIGHYNAITGMRNGQISHSAIIAKTFPVKMSYAISRNIKKFEEEIDAYNKEREKLCKELCEKDRDGKPVMEDGGKAYKMSDAAKETFNKELEELLDTETEVNVHMIPESILEQCMDSERYHVPSTKDILTIDFMIEEGK